MAVSLLFWLSFGLLWVVVTVQGVVLLKVRRAAPRDNHTAGPVTLRAVPRGRAVTSFLRDDLALDAGSRAALDSQPLGLLLLTTATCGMCRVAAREAFALGRRSPWAVTVVVQGSAAEYAGFVAETAAEGRTCVHDEHGHVAATIGIPFFPTAVVVRRGLIADAAAMSGEGQLNRYLAQQAANLSEPSSPGDPA